MADAIFIGIVCAFGALCVGYIRWCDRIIGADVTIADAPRRDETEPRSTTVGPPA